MANIINNNNINNIIIQNPQRVELNAFLPRSLVEHKKSDGITSGSAKKPKVPPSSRERPLIETTTTAAATKVS